MGLTYRADSTAAERVFEFGNGKYHVKDTLWKPQMNSCNIPWESLEFKFRFNSSLGNIL